MTHWIKVNQDAYSIVMKQLNGFIGKTKYPSVGLDGPEDTYLGDKFDNLVMAYHITKDNFITLLKITSGWYSSMFIYEIINNPVLFLCCIKGKHDALYTYNKNYTHMSQKQLLFIAGCCCQVITRVTNWFHRRLSLLENNCCHRLHTH